MNVLIEENVDIELLPIPIVDINHEHNPKDSEFTIGDLHANTMKLIFMLIKHRIASGINNDDYNNLFKIYKMPKENLNKDTLFEFNKILDKMKFDNFNNTVTVRLIGDELADRGSNDYFTLKVFQKLAQHKVKLEILVSNHSIEFILACESKSRFTPIILHCEHSISLHNLQHLVTKDIVEKDEILKIAEEAYQPNVKAIAYSIDLYSSEITIYSHAPIGLNSIKNVAEQFKVGYEDATVEDLKNTIDNINSKFQHYIKSKQVNGLCPAKYMQDGYEARDTSQAPFIFLMWNRDYKDIDRPKEKNSYKLKFVHGHDSLGKSIDNIVNLDNVLGKVSKNNGIYSVFYSTRRQITAQHDLEKSFLEQLNVIKTKAEELKKNNYLKASEAAAKLHKTVKEQADIFLRKKGKHTELDVLTFNNICSLAIKEAHIELDKHRGWKQILGNLALAVIGLGALYAAATVVNKLVTGKFLFFKTDSENKVDKLEEAIRVIIKNKI